MIYHIVYKISEPLYEFLSDKLKEKNITFCAKLADLPLSNEFPHKDKQQLVLFDNQVKLAMIYEDVTQNKLHSLKIAMDEPDNTNKLSHN